MDCHSGAWNAKIQSINDSTFKHTRCLVVVFPPPHKQRKNVNGFSQPNFLALMVSHRIELFQSFWVTVIAFAAGTEKKLNNFACTLSREIHQL